MRIPKKLEKAKALASSASSPLQGMTLSIEITRAIWYSILSVVEDCSEDLGSSEVGEEYLKLRLSVLGLGDATGYLVIYMMAAGVLTGGSQEGFVKIKPNREHPVLDDASKEMFEQFWAIYPRKEAKLRCMRAWLRLSLIDRKMALEASRSFALVWSGRQLVEINRYCALPTTWLTEGRFLDNVVKSAATDPSIEAGKKWLEERA